MIMNNGMFIAFEGIDGSGKTTQSKILAERLSSKRCKVIHTFEPTNSEIGKIIRENLKGSVSGMSHETMALLFAADRIEHSERIKNQLNAENIVISDRYLMSSIAYQGAFTSAKWVREINKPSIQMLEPDLYIYIDLPPEIAMERIWENREKTEFFEREEYLKKIYEIYENQLNETCNYIRVDGTKSQEEIQQIIFKEVLKRIS